MTPSSLQSIKPIHTAIIMDGNGRWATSRGLPRIAGHRAGAEAVRRVVEAAPSLGIRTLTLFAFSSDNWKRPPAEVRGLFALVEHFLRRELARCAEEGVEVRAVGRRDRLPWSVLAAIEEAEARTRSGARLTLRFALDYSSRDALVKAAAIAGSDSCSREAFSYALAMAYGEPGRRTPDVDLLIRSAGEQRLSDFLLWESAYAEIHFTQVLWPDFGQRALREAMDDYRGRHRTFGGLPSPMDSPQAIPTTNQRTERRSA
ncbi:MAG: di-trans,poly-cis-decaprenylcistransferase [Bryobacterales bacterium]|nr:di-trans,poly-cis-decaprenylcistransferase [Bryobacterales bacterium]